MSTDFPQKGYDKDALQSENGCRSVKILINLGAGNMIKFLTLAAVAAGLSAAHADEIKPLAAQHISLGDVQGVAYFTDEAKGFRVVATLVQGEDGRPVRIIATLVDGQSLWLSIPGDEGAPEEAVEMVRNGGVLTLRDPIEPLTASIQ